MVSPLLRIGAALIFLLFSRADDNITLSGSESYYKLALKRIAGRDFTAAVENLQSFIRENPDSADAYRVLADLQLYLNADTEARSYFESLLSKNSKNPYLYYVLAKIDLRQKDYDGAIEKLKRAISLKPDYAEAYGHRDGLPEVYHAQKDLDSGFEYFRDLNRNDSLNSRAYYGLARCYARKGNWKETLKYLKNAIDLDPNLTLAYYSLVYTYGKTRDFEKMRRYSRILSEKALRDEDLDLAAYAYYAIGKQNYDNGEYLNALVAFNSAMELARQSGSLTREARIFNNTASINANLGNYDKALLYFESALDLYQKSGEVSSHARTLTNMASVYKDMGKYEQAIKYYDEAIVISNSLPPKDAMERKSLIYSNMAEIYEKKGDFEKANELLFGALDIAKKLDISHRQGFTLRNIGRVYEGKGEPLTAKDYYEKSLAIGINDSTLQLIWESLAGLGSTSESLGETHEATDYYRETIAIYDTVRSEFGIDQMGSNFLEDKYEVYPSIVRLLAQAGNPAEAFEYAEKYKASNINNIFDKFVAKENQLAGLMSDKLSKETARITKQLLMLNAQKSAETSKRQRHPSKILELDQQITSLQLRKAAALRDLKRSFPDAFRTPSSVIPDVAEVQGILQSKHQALVEYIVGPKGVSVFVITGDTLAYTLLPLQREDLKDMMARLSPIFGSGPNSGIDSREKIVNHELADFTLSPAAELCKAIFEPIGDLLSGIDHLVIVPDDVLYYLPFEMLVTDTTHAETPYDFANARFLIEDYNISYNSSAGQLDSGTELFEAAKGGILAMGNPDFDDQVSEEFAYELETTNLAFSGNVVRGNKLLSLPDSEKEVKDIGNVFGRAMSNVFTGRDATEANFRQHAFSSKILHFATHFLANDNYPLYSKIVLSRDEQAGDDGYLQAYEIFGMQLNADLAVLSACNSGLGMLRKGEGLIGITRAFRSSGVRSQVVSLWNVNDKATRLIMDWFYRNLQDGLSMSEALRQSKIRYMKEAASEKMDPFYWAPFVLIGDDKTMITPDRVSENNTTFVLIAALVLLLLPFAFSRYRLGRINNRGTLPRT